MQVFEKVKMLYFCFSLQTGKVGEKKKHIYEDRTEITLQLFSLLLILLLTGLKYNVATAKPLKSMLSIINMCSI